MLERLNLNHVLFLDIETVPAAARWEDLPDSLRELWEGKARKALRKYDEPLTDEELAESFRDRAGIFAEFGKIICISVGIIVKQPSGMQIRLKSFADRDEARLLEDFRQMVEQYYPNPNRHYFCGHNIREFDIPYICRRMVIHQQPLPEILNLAGKKPWETKHLLDTLELWKFGDYKNYTSLKLLAAVFGIPSPKDDIDGSQVGRVFWEEDDLERIARYCEKDVLATAQLLFRYMRMPLLTDEQITFVDRS